MLCPEKIERMPEDEALAEVVVAGRSLEGYRREEGSGQLRVKGRGSGFWGWVNVLCTLVFEDTYGSALSTVGSCI